jgi:hypothetical protein
MNIRIAALLLLLLLPLATHAQVANPPIKPAWTFLQPVPGFPNPNSEARTGVLVSYRADNAGDVVCLVATLTSGGASYVGTQLLWISPLGKLILKKDYVVNATFGIVAASPSGITISITFNGSTTLQHFQRTAAGIKQTETALTSQYLVPNTTQAGSFDPSGFVLSDAVLDPETNYTRERLQRFR